MMEPANSVIILLLSLPPTWFTGRLEQARTQSDAVAAIHRLGGRVVYDCQIGVNGLRPYAEPPGPEWLRKLLGIDFLADVRSVSFFHATRLDDDDLACLSPLSGLTDLLLTNTQITDAGLRRLTGLKSLERLLLDHTHITDEGLGLLSDLKHLQGISLEGTRVGDAGLQHLSQFKQLEVIALYGTTVTEKGIKEIAMELPNCHITYRYGYTRGPPRHRQNSRSAAEADRFFEEWRREVDAEIDAFLERQLRELEERSFRGASLPGIP
ncbi:MAG: hypothetical protein ISR77_18840 [Pirellulaceae bacterium]|nr:hypothetical protein [Pirellulaceae bacterium]